jgi:hypothetical protein
MCGLKPASIFCAILSLSALSSAETASQASWQIYRDGKNGFEFRFPASMKFESRDGSGDLEEAQTRRTVLTTEVWPPDECMHAPGEKAITSAREVALQRAKDVCQADGPNGSSFCADPVRVQPFASKEGANGFEIYLTRAGEHCDTDEEDRCVSPMKREVYGKKGPVYAFDISTDTMTKILYVEPTGVEPATFSPGSKADLKPIREILSTLKVFRVDRPKATCIQDLSPGHGFALPVQPKPPKKSSPTSQ